MKKKLIICMFVFLFINKSSNCFSQNKEGKTEDAARIVLTTYIPTQVENLPDEARSFLADKLTKIATQNGMGGGLNSSRFIITANISVGEKNVLATAPPTVALSLDVTLYIGDGVKAVKYASKTMSVKGTGTNEAKAYIAAIKGVNTNDASLKDFVAEGKNKIIQYYNDQCDFIIKEAQSLESQNKHDEAIINLSSVPPICKDCFDKCMTAIAPIYKKYIDFQCKANLQKAKTAWAASPNAVGAESVKGYLEQIDPEAACFKDVISFSQEVGKKMKEVDKREWDFQVKTKTDLISSYRDVGVAYGNGQPKTITYNVGGWFPPVR